jgi:hypothetical protein
VIVKATQQVIADLNSIEAKNSRVLYETKNDQIGLQTVAIAISAPTVEDVGAISQSVTAALEGVPADRKAEVREHLMWYYNEHTRYIAKYRVLIAEFRNGDNTSTLTVGSFDDLNEAIPNENGIIHFSKPSGLS